jgi:UDP-glucose 4-epimerase
VIFGDGSQTRDFVYVGDVVEALLLAMEKDFGCNVFNVGTGVAYSFNQIVELLNELLGKDIKPVRKPMPMKNYVFETLADTIKAEKVLGFKAKTSLKQGIKSLINEQKD